MNMEPGQSDENLCHVILNKRGPYNETIESTKDDYISKSTILANSNERSDLVETE